MPHISKKVLSQYIHTECKRQLRLNLSPDNRTYQEERIDQNMPPKQNPRPGLSHITQAGDEWQAEKLHDLETIFGTDALICKRDRTKYHKIKLEDALITASPNKFIIEAEYDVGHAFESTLDISEYRTKYNLDYASLRPDIIEVLPPSKVTQSVDPSGDILLLQGNERLGLRIIDIKLTSEPSPGYFSEIAYYMMSLAGWLIDHQLDQQFVVVHDGAVWPGSHEASRLVVTYHELISQGIPPTFSVLRNAMDEDLEQVPFDVFAFRVRRFLKYNIPEVLDIGSWRDLDWHVDNRCKGCDYLGYPWKNSSGQLTCHPDQCIPMAEREGHLSRVTFLPRGARKALESQNIRDVSSLATLATDSQVFQTHQALRATCNVVSSRAVSLQEGGPIVPQDAGTSVVMPKWTDLHIYLSVDFDLSSAITIAFGLKAFWLEPPTRTQRDARRWDSQVFLVDRRDIDAELRELLAFLERIYQILEEARIENEDTRVQFYLWDSLQYNHLTRVIGRHLNEILDSGNISHLAWLFPPEELLPNPQMVGPRTITRSPSRRSNITGNLITIVRDVIRTQLAVPIPHYYSLIRTAQIYHNPDHYVVSQFHVHPLFEDALSDQIPSERAHDIWSRSTASHRYWRDQMDIFEETVKRKLLALEAITRRLEEDLRTALILNAPPISSIRSPSRQNRLSLDGQLWYAFSKLDAALNELEIRKIRSMPPYEREAKFSSARLIRRLDEVEKEGVLNRLNFELRSDYYAYEMRANSCEVKLREGDFLVALAPESDAGFLDATFGRIAEGIRLGPNEWTRMERVTDVTIVAIDRDNKIIVLKSDRNYPTILNDLENHGLVDFSSNVILDPTYRDYFTPKLLQALKDIGNPGISQHNSISVRRAIGLTGSGSRTSADTPPAGLLWDAVAVHEARVERRLEPIKMILKHIGLDLNNRQWDAWEEALSSRLQLIWGPPGTGKSRTARAVVIGAALEAYIQNRPIRILICAFTYIALDNVLRTAYEYLQSLLPDPLFEAYRIRSSSRIPPDVDDSLHDIDTVLETRAPSERIIELRSRLNDNLGSTLVGATPHQIHNLLIINGGRAQREFFDVILIDEASQIDVSNSILPLCSLANGGSVILAGDPKQLPPIHKAEPPRGLENLVGSIYKFYNEYYNIESVMLNVNYRSNKILVDFSLSAGYEHDLSSFSPDLRLRFINPVTENMPPNWPNELYWTKEWSEVLDPEKPAVCFLYSEGRSSQWNQFEADAVASMVFLLRDRLSNQIGNERDPKTGTLKQSIIIEPYSDSDFWDRGIGIVTPHRAQQGLIVSRLQRIFEDTGINPTKIRDAVDTVERFQGQERDIIIASFAMGDPDAIRDEDEFLLSLNRFNVMASRARAKLIVLISQQVVDHLSDDLNTLRDSSLLKNYVESFCRNNREMTLGYIKRGESEYVSGLFKYY